MTTRPPTNTVKNPGRKRTGLALLCVFFTVSFSFSALSKYQQTATIEQKKNVSEITEARIRTMFDYDGYRLVLESDRQKSTENALLAAGNVVLTLLDMTVACDEVEYDTTTGRLSAVGPARFRRNRVSLTSARIVFDIHTKTVTLHDATGSFYDTLGRSEREFFLTGGMVQRIKNETLRIYWGAETTD